MTPERGFVVIDRPSTGVGPRVSIRLGRDLIYRGPLPPLVDESASGSLRPGVHLDIVWRLGHAVTGELHLVQRFRDGVEIPSTKKVADADLRLEVEAHYTQMLGVCYHGTGFGPVVPIDYLVSHFALFGCAEGLIHSSLANRRVAPSDVALRILWEHALGV